MEISTLSLSSSLSCSNHRRLVPAPSSLLASSRSSIFNPNFTIYNKKALALIRPVVVNRKRGLSCTCLFGLGVPELVVIAGVAALVFGPKQLPQVGRSIGKTLKSFQQAAKEFETELKKEPDTDTIIEPPPSQSQAASVSEAEKQDTTVSSS